MDILWQPPPQAEKKTHLYQFYQRVRDKFKDDKLNENFDYTSFWQWGTQNIESFWLEVWDYGQVVSSTGKPDVILQNPELMPGARWFPQAKLNYAENLMRHCERFPNQDAMIFWGEDQIKVRVKNNELLEQVKNLAGQLKQFGVQKGDRVAGYLPNKPEAIIAMLATTSIGAIWSSASPDFGVQGVLDRFGQIEPKVLFVTNRYFYNGKSIDCMDKNRQILSQLPSVKKAVVISYLPSDKTQMESKFVLYADLIEQKARKLEFEQVEFSHPLFIMFSSGTTGVPKCIVHGHGGTLLQHLKEHQLHCDLKFGDRLFYFTTLGWMMWNWLVSGLASGATLLLYDGAPFAKEGRILFDFAEQEKCSHFGTSAKFIDSAAKQLLEPMKTHQLDSLKMVLSTGSPLSAEGFDYVYEKIKKDVILASISGGTDIISCFVLGCPLLPVRRGEIQCRGLGMAVDVFDDNGNSISQQKGELVCVRPFPSMPVGFWNDSDGQKYHAAYFSRFANVWCHGDYVELTKNGGMIIYGRSDAVLNPGGVRIGTAEIYRQVERLPEIVESIVVGQDWKNDVRVVLFVKLKEGLALNEELVEKIKKTIRSNATPRHVPSKILQVSDIPRTKSGKIVELAVRNIIHNQPVKNIEALANPEALDFFKNRVELQAD